MFINLKQTNRIAKENKNMVTKSEPTISNTVRVVMLGQTGAGKSELGNVLAGRSTKNPLFESSIKGESCTSEICEKEAHWLGELTASKYRLVDTCGFGDSEGRDEAQFEDLLWTLSRYGAVNSFLIVLNGESARLDANLKAMFIKLKEYFSETVFDHMIVVYTHWSHDKKTVKQRKDKFEKEIKDSTLKSLEELRIKEINDFLFGIKENKSSAPVRCIFIDCLDAKETDTGIVSEAEKAFNTEQLCFVKDFCMGKPYYNCKSLEKSLMEAKKLKDDEKEFFEKIMKQNAKVVFLMQQDENFKKEYLEHKDNMNQKKVQLHTSLNKQFDSYFDERGDIIKVPSLYNDIWTICKNFSANDTEKRLSTSNFAKDLLNNLNKKLPIRIEERIKSFVEKEAQEFIKYCENDLKSLLKGVEVLVPLDLMPDGGVMFLVTTSFATTGALALAEVGLFAVLGVVGAVFVAVGGIIMLRYALNWKREDEILKFTKKVLDKYASGDMKSKLKDICANALERAMLEITYELNERLINSKKDEQEQ